ncbi:MFS transporter [Bacillus sp. DTU_2020_1000418_1_SI_GHA_SEK_038]|uniref:MFS transporter n=1 Tax=Bacillus sp. DTU_2020_1000418_1_SI_GHA_SEK_038 TaxID=3077585 RepID=UPI0028EDB445|nr:MFS transporter [Bacillus sp. DTU_2020_1000418_1_SI_GHA_SEK_038]WNS75381.1 MFS transporter [Bacillus sp. DTU_2020_1000418_1_SI_GHA_SEK_038]
MEKQNSKYRWVVFAAVLFIYCVIASQRTAPGLVTNQIMKDFSLTASTIGLLTSIQFLAYASLQIPIGILSDRFGPNIFLIAGTLLNGAGTLIYSLAEHANVLLLARLLVGIGDATIWVNLVLILSLWFKGNEFVVLIGVAGMVGSLGFLMATVPFSEWITLWGWRKPFFTTGIILCLCGFILYFILVHKPKQMFKTDFTSVSASPKIREKREKTLHLLHRILTSRQAWATFCCHFGIVGTYIGFIGSWAVPYGMDMYGMTRSDASQLIMIGLMGAIIGAPFSSWMANRLGVIKRPYVVIHFITFMCWVTFFVLGGNPPFSILILLFLIIGLCNGANTLTFAVVRKSFDVKDVGFVSGFANTGGFLSAVLLPSIFGKVLDHYHTTDVGYHYGFLIPVIFSLVGLIGGILIKEQRREAKKPKKALA